MPVPSLMPKSSPGAAKLTQPTMLFARSPDELSRSFESGLTRCRALLAQILEVQGSRTIANTLVPFDELSRILHELDSIPKFLFDVHPDAAVRAAGDKAYQEAERFSTELSLNRGLYDALAALDVSHEDDGTRYAMTKILRDFHLAGVDRDEATRHRVMALRDEITSIGQDFDKNIREDVRTIRVDGPADLDGLPPDFVKAHAPGPDGTIAISTNYPDSVPVFRYARKPEVRRDLMKEYLNRGHPANLDVLARLIERRDDLARLLGYRNWADYLTIDKMIGSAGAVESFLNKVAGVAEPRAKRDYEELLARKRDDLSDARGLDRWDLNYYTELVRADAYAFDAKRLRPYFEFGRVRDGLFAITGKIFDVRYRRISGVKVWHPSVEVYDIYRGRARLGRFYLDLHPRDDKYTHAAAVFLVVGLAGKQLPQAALMCNFPDPSGGGPALMDFSEVDTFFHEFGHLLHALLSGGVRWVRNSPNGLELDFIEAPSQMLEEWVRDPEVLGTFARHHETGEPVPPDLIAQMRRAEAFGRAYEVQRQLLYATLSLLYYTRDAAGIDTTAVLREAHTHFPLIPHFEGTHFQCGFGHLNGYSAAYYTYMWSLVIAKDLFSRFRERGSLLDPTEAARYRDLVIGRGGEKPAAELVRDFLGREIAFDAFEAWLREAG